MNTLLLAISCSTHLAMRTTQRLSAGFLLIAISLVSIKAEQAFGQTIANPSFETPDLPVPGSTQASPIGASWQFNPGEEPVSDLSGIVAYTDLFNNDFQPIAPPPDGDQFAFMETDASIQQTISGFTIGQAYRLDWFQGYGGSNASGGSAVTVQLQASGGGAVQSIAPLELANSPSLAARSSDVFVATSETYDLIVQSSDEVPFGYSNRKALVDDFSFVPVSEPATTRSTFSTTLALTSASNMEIDLLLGGVSLGADLTSPLTGLLDVEFDIINGQIASLRFNSLPLDVDPTITSLIDLGPLGTADVTLTNLQLDLSHKESSQFGKQSVAVDANGEFLLGSAFLGFDGLAEVDLEGPISAVLGDSLTFEMDELPPVDLGITFLNGVTLFQDPGIFDFTPTGNPSEFLITVDIPVLAITIFGSSLGLEVALSGFIQAQGTIIVPEPSGIALALIGATFAGGAGWRRKRQ